MKMDAECNETTPMMSFDRFHEDLKILTQMMLNPNRQVRKETRTPMEATFETLRPL